MATLKKKLNKKRIEENLGGRGWGYNYKGKMCWFFLKSGCPTTIFVQNGPNKNRIIIIILNPITFEKMQSWGGPSSWISIFFITQLSFCLTSQSFEIRLNFLNLIFYGRQEKTTFSNLIYFLSAAEFKNRVIGRLLA